MSRLMFCLALCLALFTHGAIAQTSLKKIRVNGAELHYVDQGKGVAVIFVHGGLDDYRVWQDANGRVFPALSRRDIQPPLQLPERPEQNREPTTRPLLTRTILPRSSAN